MSSRGESWEVNMNSGSSGVGRARVPSQSPGPASGRFQRPITRTRAADDSMPRSSSGLGSPSRGSKTPIATTRASKVFEEGDDVKVKRKNNPGYEPARIVTKHTGAFDGTYDVRYKATGTEERRVTAARIAHDTGSSSGGGEEKADGAAVEAASKFRMGMKVEGMHSRLGKWTPATVLGVDLRKGTLELRYGPGDEERGVPADTVRLPQDASFQASGGLGDLDSDPRHKIGAEVEARRNGGMTWEKANVIDADRAREEYSVRYHDGRSERNISYKHVRAISDMQIMKKGGFSEGDKVEGNYRGRGKWYPGRVARVRANGTIDIDYDDGEKELGLDTDLVRNKETSSGSSPELREGDKVEGNYRGRGRWYPGKISRVRANGTYDIDYDDGEKETGLQSDLVRSKEAASSPARTAAPELREGDKVEGNYRGRGRWYPGKISRVRANGTYDIDYDDGEKETGLQSDLVRSKEAASSPARTAAPELREGDKVEGNYRGRGRWYPGKISRVRANGTYDIDYDDGEKETGLQSDLVRSKEAASSPARNAAPELREGDKVEGNYRGRGRWYPGKISRVRLNGSVDIDYDDGEKETGVAADLVRAKDDGHSSPSRSRAPELREGDKVEGNYRGRGRWYPGKISRVRLNGSVDIDYDDGEKETMVEKDNVRSLERAPSPGRAPELREGDKVEGNYRGRGRWYPGKISRVRANGTYDIDYDDGEKETGLQSDLVRSKEAASSPARNAAPELREGDKVEGNYRGRGRWYPGKISRVRLNGSVDIDYDDGEKETGVAADLVRALDSVLESSPVLLRVRDRVEAKPRRESRWFPGTVSYVGHSTVEVVFDDREFGRQELDTRDVRSLSERDDPKFSARERDREPRRDNDRETARDRPRRRSRSRSPSVDAVKAGALKRILQSRTVEDVRLLVEKYIGSNADSTLFQVFAEYDDDSHTHGKIGPAGRISKKEFKSCLKTIFNAVAKHEMRASRRSARSDLPDSFEEFVRDEELGALADSLAYPLAGKPGHGTVAYNEFVVWAIGTGGRKGDINTESETAMDVHMKLSKEALERSKLRPKDILKYFSSSRSYSNGYVKTSEFEKVLKRLYSKISRTDLDDILKRFDANDEGTVDYNVFISWLYCGFDVAARDISVLKTKFAHQLCMLDSSVVERSCEDLSRHDVFSIAKFSDFCEDFGFVLSGCERSILFNAFDADAKGEFKTEIITTMRKEGADAAALKKKSSIGKKGRGFKLDDKDVLLSANLREDLAQSALSYINSSSRAGVDGDRNRDTKAVKSLGQLIYSYVESSSKGRSSTHGNTNALTRKAFRKFFSDGLNMQFREEEENLVFESFDNNSTGTILCDDVLTFLYALAYDNDSMEVCSIWQNSLSRHSGVTPKEFARSMAKYDALNNGFIDDKNFEKVLKKLVSGSSASKFGGLNRFSRSKAEPKNESIDEDTIADLKNFLDPGRDGQIDRYYASAIATICLDCGQAESNTEGTKLAEIKLKNCFRIMRLRGVDYTTVLNELATEEKDGGDSDDERQRSARGRGVGKSSYLGLEDAVDLFEVSIGVPLLRCELYALLIKMQRHGNVPVDTLLERMESETDLGDKSGRDGVVDSSHGNDSFGKTLWRKLCKLRSRRNEADTLRAALLEADRDDQGRLSKREMQRLLDKYADLTDPEAALLEENLSFYEGGHKMSHHHHASLSASASAASSSNYVDYPLLLLLMHEPVAEVTAVTAAGTSLMVKMTRAGGDSFEALRRLFQLLYRNFSSTDRNSSGFITVEAAEQVIQQECDSVDDATMDLILVAFQDRNSDCIMYPEMYSFLVSCHINSVVHRLYELDLIRQKQGYNLIDFLQKLSRKSKVDHVKLSDQFVSLGLLISECAVHTLYHNFAIDKKSNKNYLSIDALATAIARVTDPDANENTTKLRGSRRSRGEGQLTDYIGKDGKDEISDRILKEYDEKLKRAVQLAFDIFDKENANALPEEDLERIMHCIGYDATFTELDDLLNKIDRSGSGIMEYSNFMGCVMDFCRTKYGNSLSVTRDRLQIYFNSLDRNSDGTLTHAEFAHVSRSSHSNLTEDEMNALIDYLDVDGDGCIAWEEFSRLLAVLDDQKYLNTLPRTLHTAMRKIQYSHLPDPRKYITMHQGLPKCYRKSTLHEVAKAEGTSLQAVLSSKVAAIASENERNIGGRNNKNEVQFEISVDRVEGVPSENEDRTSDVLHRGVRFCLVQTDKAPTADDAGHPPKFLSNVSKMHANTSAVKRDLWEFDHPDNINSDLTSFCKAVVDEPYIYDDGNDRGGVRVNSHHTALDQLYVFVELVMTVRVGKNVQIGRKGIVKGGKTKKAVINRDEDSDDENVVASTTAAIRDYFGFSSTKNRESTSLKRSVRGRSGNKNDRDRSRDGDRDRSRDHNENDHPNSRDSSPERPRDSEREDDLSSPLDDDSTENEDVPTVELTCAWCLVPVSKTLAQSHNSQPVKLKLDMYGGSPFAVVKMDKIKRRPGAFSNLARMLGFKVKPEITITLRPLPSAVLPPLEKHKNHGSTPSPEQAALRSLFSLLPNNIVLPRKSIIMAGMFRQLLAKEAVDRSAHRGDEALPQTGACKSQNILLSAFPPMIDDEAVRRVLMYLWSLEAPPSLFKKNLHQITSSDLMSRQILSVFRQVVLRVWRAFSSPDARPNPLQPVESAKAVARRENNVLNMVGLKMYNGHLFPIAADLGKNLIARGGADIVRMGGIDVKSLISRNDKQPGILSLVPLSEHLYSPFSTQELVLNNHERAEF
eukprot:GSChrysophyteH1.ASY1.ANO1.2925.1 assembled CDS